MTEAGLVHPPLLLERIGRPILDARERLGPKRVVELQAGVSEPSLELALELDAQSTSIASPNE